MEPELDTSVRFVALFLVLLSTVLVLGALILWWAA